MSKQVFSTGETAKICSVSTAAVTRWCDSGRLKHYRIPGSKSRRIPRDELARFMAEQGLFASSIAAYAAIDAAFPPTQEDTDE